VRGLARRPGRSAGFTLMEVMVAMAIVAILGGLVWGSFSPIYAAKEIVEEEADRYHGLRLAMDRITRDLSMAFLSDRFDAKRFRERPTQFVADDSGENDTLRFTTLSHERLYEDAKEGDQALVEYRIGRDPERRDVEVLLRREKTVFDDQPEDGGNEVVLAEGVEGLDVKFWDVKKEEWVSEWDTTDVEHKNSLPERVQVNLYARDDEGKVRRYTTQAKIFLRTPLGR
jgi:general secretion pathway protein J